MGWGFSSEGLTYIEHSRKLTLVGCQRELCRRLLLDGVYHAVDVVSRVDYYKNKGGLYDSCGSMTFKTAEERTRNVTTALDLMRIRSNPIQKLFAEEGRIKDVVEKDHALTPGQKKQQLLVIKRDYRALREMAVR